MVNSTITRAHSIERPLAALPQELEQQWRNWLTMYNLDPDQIPLGTWIAIDDNARTIHATYFQGETKPDGSFAAFYDRDRKEFETEQVTRHLESKPAPFPSDGTSQS